MFFTHYLTIGYLQKIDYQEEKLPLSNALWIDCYQLIPLEKERLSKELKLHIPTEEEMRSIETSSRFYEEEGILYMTANMTSHSESDRPTSDAVTFILTPTSLLTLRYCQPLAFELFNHRAAKTFNLFTSPEKILLGLLETIIDRAADILEHSGEAIELLSDEIFEKNHSAASLPKTSRPSRELPELLNKIGQTNDIVSKLHQSLANFYRMVKFLGLHLKDHSLQTTLSLLNDDINSLIEYNSFLSHKLNFLLDATLGRINIEQNTIIKIFSVAAVIFLPPTLIASIYGMNFHYIPELDWPFGYPVAIVLMVVSALLPYLFFKKKKWL